MIENAACEPEIEALGAFLSAMGAQIEGIGSPRVVVNGVSELHPADAEMIADRIEAGTILAAAAITGGDVEATAVEPAHLGAVISARGGRRLRGVSTAPSVSARPNGDPLGDDAAVP